MFLLLDVIALYERINIVNYKGEDLFLSRTGLPATRVYLTTFLTNVEEPSTRCSFSTPVDLDPRFPTLLSYALWLATLHQLLPDPLITFRI